MANGDLARVRSEFIHSLLALVPDWAGRVGYMDPAQGREQGETISGDIVL
jgi:hypothetical protein